MDLDHAFLQGITLGAIAFAIPVLWNTVSEINGGITKHPKQHPLSILQNIKYKRIQRSFINWIMIPSVVLAFLGLVVFPLIPKTYNLIAEFIVAAWFLSLIWSVKLVYDKHELDLFKYVKSADIYE